MLTKLISQLLLGIQSVITICIGVHRYKIITDNQKIAEMRLMATNQPQAQGSIKREGQ
jgi:hypothetical protein